MSVSQKSTWFYKIRGSYLPKAWQGQLLYLTYVVYIVAVPVTWYKNGHDLWLLLVNVIPLLAGAALLVQYIAAKHSR